MDERVRDRLSMAVAATITPAQDLGALESEWRALEREADCSFFLSWGWLGPWAVLIARQTELHLLRCETAGRTVGLAFLTRRLVRRRRGLIRATQLQLNEFNAPSCDMIIEYNGILSANGYERSCWEAFARAVQASSLRWDELACRSLPPDQHLLAQQAFRSLREEVDQAVPSWVVRLTKTHQDAEQLQAVFKKKTRQQMRQSLREFETLGPIATRFADSHQEAGKFFGEMGVFHSARWKRVGQKGSFDNQTWRDFHAGVIAEGLHRGEVQLARVTVGDSPIGFIYGFAWRGRFFAVQTGFKPQERNSLRSGYVAHFCVMQQNASRGLEAYDLLPDDDDSYKRRLADPEGMLTTVRYQRRRARFAVERLAQRVWSKFIGLRVAHPTGSSVEEER